MATCERAAEILRDSVPVVRARVADERGRRDHPRPVGAAVRARDLSLAGDDYAAALKGILVADKPGSCALAVFGGRTSNAPTWRSTGGSARGGSI
jgi:hypothetical protein